MFWKMLRERARTQAVSQIGISTGPAEPDFNHFVERAACAFAAPISILTLVATDTVWVRACTDSNLRRTLRQNSFCSHALDQGGPLEVCNALADPRFSNLPAVTGEPYIRYYIGAPLVLNGGVEIGALCVVDTHPRLPTSLDQRAYLVGLARQAAQALERQAHIRNGVRT